MDALEFTEGCEAFCAPPAVGGTAMLLEAIEALFPARAEDEPSVGRAADCEPALSVVDDETFVGTEAALVIKVKEWAISGYVDFLVTIS